MFVGTPPAFITRPRLAKCSDQRQGLGDSRVEKHASSHLIRKLWLREYPIPHEGRVKVFSREAGAYLVIRLSTEAEGQETSDKDMDPLDNGGISCGTGGPNQGHTVSQYIHTQFSVVILKGERLRVIAVRSLADANQ